MTSQSDAPTDDDGLPAARDAAIGRFPRQLGEWLRTHPKLWVSGLALVTVAVVGVTVWTEVSDNEAETRVRDYLEAVRAKDLDKAEGMLDQRAPGASHLMTTEALDTNWTIQSLESENFRPRLSFTDVDAVLEGQNGEEAAFKFKLQRPDSERGEPFEITNGYAGLRIMHGPDRHLRINGQPVAGDEEENHGEDLWLYPGVYRFGHEMEDDLDVDWQQRMLAGGTYTVDGSGQDVDESNPQSEPWSLTDEGEERAQELMDAHIDECAAVDEAVAPGCPFGADRVPAGDSESVSGDDLDNIDWEVEEYPEVTVWENVGALQYVDRSRGLVRLTATGETAAGTVEVDVECEMRTTELHMTIGDDRQPTVDSLKEDDTDPFKRDTCPEA